MQKKTWKHSLCLIERKQQSNGECCLGKCDENNDSSHGLCCSAQRNLEPLNCQSNRRVHTGGTSTYRLYYTPSFPSHLNVYQDLLSSEVVFNSYHEAFDESLLTKNVRGEKVGVTESAGEGWKETLTSDQPQHIASAKLLTLSPSLGPAAVRACTFRLAAEMSV